MDKTRLPHLGPGIPDHGLEEQATMTHAASRGVDVLTGRMVEKSPDR
ncbi:hypothetical protein [Komagataeibacter swingsii]|nr:hypothetical protein [Komagataeibacter swingsii]